MYTYMCVCVWVDVCECVCTYMYVRVHWLYTSRDFHIFYNGKLWCINIDDEDGWRRQQRWLDYTTMTIMKIELTTKSVESSADWVVEVPRRLGCLRHQLRRCLPGDPQSKSKAVVVDVCGHSLPTLLGNVRGTVSWRWRNGWDCIVSIHLYNASWIDRSQHRLMFSISRQTLQISNYQNRKVNSKNFIPRNLSLLTPHPWAALPGRLLVDSVFRLEFNLQ